MTRLNQPFLQLFSDQMAINIKMLRRLMEDKIASYVNGCLVKLLDFNKKPVPTFKTLQIPKDRESSGRGSCRRDVARSWLCSEEVQMTETAAEWPGIRRKVTRPDCIFGCWPPRLPDWYHEVLWTLMKGAWSWNDSLMLYGWRQR
ncbi:hypothetical protein GH714_027263 [Hevea brasiliensis]|uniref:Uncharacterized protein n=1 Tax=Hevea brasiliensis TaxID=3981 RepID=A0A6A6ML93_HEVBR|nr:hypothetical protein GH714_027263 [Hevea brasiliensis]